MATSLKRYEIRFYTWTSASLQIGTLADDRWKRIRKQGYSLLDPILRSGIKNFSKLYVPERMKLWAVMNG